MFNPMEFIPNDISKKFEFLNYNHAIEILSVTFLSEWNEILSSLKNFSINKNEICQSGGNESPIPPKFSNQLNPLGWKEIKITGDLLIKFYPRKNNTKSGIFSEESNDQKLIKNYIDGHNIDFIKGRVALDIEWNSKDQTFDRDLFAMRTYYECDIISVGIIITRSEQLNPVFKKLGVISKYGASTTWMGKLKPRLESRRHGGCPLLAIGIKPACITDLEF